MNKVIVSSPVGALCEYSESGASENIRQTCGSYADYITSLSRTCQPGQPGRLVWTPDDTTPDLVYYQVCRMDFLTMYTYTHILKGVVV